MIIECIIPREGNTEVSHAGVNFIFEPRPDLTGDEKAKVCEICSDHAITRFLDLKGMYREYQIIPKAKPEEHRRVPRNIPKNEKKDTQHEESLRFNDSL